MRTVDNYLSVFVLKLQLCRRTDLTYCLFGIRHARYLYAYLLRTLKRDHCFGITEIVQPFPHKSLYGSHILRKFRTGKIGLRLVHNY